MLQSEPIEYVQVLRWPVVMRCETRLARRWRGFGHCVVLERRRSLHSNNRFQGFGPHPRIFDATNGESAWTSPILGNSRFNTCAETHSRVCQLSVSECPAFALTGTWSIRVGAGTLLDLGKSMLRTWRSELKPGNDQNSQASRPSLDELLCISANPGISPHSLRKLCVTTAQGTRTRPR